MDLQQASFIIFDVETTGLNPESGHRICEIGALKFVGEKEVDRFHSLVNPERKMDPEAQAQHKITDEELKGAPKFDEIASPFRKFLTGAVLVAQNADFDRSFLNAEFVRCGMTKLASPIVDTIPLARQVRPGLRSYGLDSLARHFHLTFNARHRSIGDCEVTAKVFLECVRALRQRGQVRTLADLVQKGGIR